jgi:hypothetical protein
VIKLVCLRDEAVVPKDGTHLKKPMLVGFAKAADLELIAKAPSFSETDPNRTIAEMLQRLPARKWQRPLDQDRIAQMAGFFNVGGHLMPNPVLLAENPDLAQTLERTDTGEFVTIQVEVTRRVKAEGALWILDGQHRITALAAAASQKVNPVPFVLLLDEDGNYTSAEFAAIFAQVTTKAKPLEEPHHTWLEYSFELGGYEPPRGDARRKAFETIVWLGSDELVPGTNTKNRFAGNIRFNPRYPDRATKVGVEGLEGVFAFAAQEFAKLSYEHYYKKPPSPPLAPRDVSGQISLAYDGLRKVIPQPQTDAAFFKPGNLYIQEGFIVGVLTYLRVHGVPAKWEEVLRRLAFDRGSWEFRGRQINTGGQHGRASRAAAIGAFQFAFGQNHLPAQASSFVSFLLGDTASVVQLIVEDSGTRGTPILTDEISNQQTVPLDGMAARGRSLRVEKAPNIGVLRITASTRTPAYWAEMTKRAASRSGLPLDDIAGDIAAQGKNGAVTVAIWRELYGGVERSTDLIFT